MPDKSKIEWTDATWNPVRGCSMAAGSETGGCLNCYAARQAVRYTQKHDPADLRIVSPGPFAGFARMTSSGPRWTGKVELIEKHLADPLKWRTPKRIFVNSMSDLFHEALPDYAIDRVFAVMAACPRHTFQILTKRPQRMLSYCRRRALAMAETRTHECPSLHNAFPDFLPNVWLGGSVENQATADERIPLLLQTPAAIRFVSYEPALGPVEFRWITRHDGMMMNSLNGTVQFDVNGISTRSVNGWPHLDQIIVGGESGPGARPFDIQWARNTVEQCAAAGVACFVKQLGARPFWPLVGGLGQWADHVRFTRQVSREAPYHWDEIHLKSRKGGDMSEWPEDLRVRQFPEVA